MRKSTNDFKLHIDANLSAIYRHLAGILMSSYALPQLEIGPPLGDVGEPGIENGINRNLSHTFLLDFFTHHRHILHRFGEIYTFYRQTDRQRSHIAIGETLRLEKRC